MGGYVIMESIKFDVEEKVLFTALDNMKGHSVVIESDNSGLMFYRPMSDFDYNLKLNSRGEIILNFENDEEEFTCGVGIKLNEVCEVDIDDNLGWLEDGQMDDYEVESIIITLMNQSSIRICVEW